VGGYINWGERFEAEEDIDDVRGVLFFVRGTGGSGSRGGVGVQLPGEKKVRAIGGKF